MAKDDDRTRHPLMTIIGAVLPALLLVIIVRTFVIGLYRVPTASMVDTVHVGDCIMGERVSLGFRTLEPGEVVTFDSPECPGVTLVKRVIATEGQIVDLRDGDVFVDGIELQEPYAAGSASDPAPEGLGSTEVSYPHVVAEGCVWVMGDNREISRDSRWFGDVSVSSVSSRVMLVYWPVERAMLVK